MSVLSERPDSLGFFYGFVPGDNRQINLREEPDETELGDDPPTVWVVYVAGDVIGRYPSKATAEAAALDWCHFNPQHVEQMS